MQAENGSKVKGRRSKVSDSGIPDSGPKPSLGSVETFLLQYVAWWGAYTFNTTDWTTREEIRVFTEQVPDGRMNELLKMVAALEVKKPRLAVFYKCLDKLLAKTKDRADREDVEVNWRKEKAESKEREREYKEALKSYPGDCVKHKIKLNYRNDKWTCWRCEAEKNTMAEPIPIDRKQRSAGNKEENGETPF